LRFYDSRHGKVVIDGKDIRDYSVEAMRDQIAIVQQEPLLFNESIKSNILFGNLNASDLQVRNAAIQANALGFIMQND
jgi:ABC-type multidrug transport system fused ATPase/permease subunit